MSLIVNGNQLKATYVSPTGDQSFTHSLSSIDQANRSTSDKTAYLSDLRSKTSKLQDEINVFLTGKMEEDKAAHSDSGRKSKVDEDKEEEMYGEEDPEQDA
ncbi:Gon7 family-domain-containing protein [Elsinoe ampelina]|uniref:EKC/KEOPS complex subunit GON7 n=1 Tax=Elsinoe ampelina TaxID=302913 RepID=A0A6A6G0E0_9PEZI|nr:Gon7 family-domain-containing protein [Elsinoe ampelina]